MTKNVKTVDKFATALKAAQEMADNNISCLLIVSTNDEPEGIITERDLVKKIIAKGENPVGVQVKDIMTEDPYTISPTTKISEAASVMQHRKFRRLPVVEDKQIVGLVTEADVVRATDDYIKVHQRIQSWIIVIVFLFMVAVYLFTTVFK